MLHQILIDSDKAKVDRGIKESSICKGVKVGANNQHSEN